VHVLWDCGHRNAYRYDRSGEESVDLMVVGNRELFPSGDQPKNLDVGMRISRGRDWKWADQDGGEGRLGTVIRTPEVCSPFSPLSHVILITHPQSNMPYQYDLVTFICIY
jgi:hypothetical protein